MTESDRLNVNDHVVPHVIAVQESSHRLSNKPITTKKSQKIPIVISIQMDQHWLRSRPQWKTIPNLAIVIDSFSFLSCLGCFSPN